MRSFCLVILFEASENGLKSNIELQCVKCHEHAIVCGFILFEQLI